MSESLSKWPRLSKTVHPRSVWSKRLVHASTVSSDSSSRILSNDRRPITSTHGDPSQPRAVRRSPSTASSSPISECHHRPLFAGNTRGDAIRFGLCASLASQCAQSIPLRLGLHSSTSYSTPVAGLPSQQDGADGVFNARVHNITAATSHGHDTRPNANRWHDVLADRPGTPRTGACTSRPGLVLFGVSAPPTSSPACPRVDLAVNQTGPSKRSATRMMKCTNTHLQLSPASRLGRACCVQGSFYYHGYNVPESGLGS